MHKSMELPERELEGDLVFGRIDFPLIVAIAVSLALPLIAYSYIGLFSRYWYDDFWTASILRDEGFVGSQIFWYTTWSGRFAFHIVVNVVESLGSWTVTILPSLAILSWVLASAFATRQIIEYFGFPRSGTVSVVLALLMVFATLGSTPDIVQSLYWQTGMLTYLLPIVILTGWCGLFVFSMSREIRLGRKVLLAVIGCALTIAVGGLSEVSGVVQLALFAVCLACVCAFVSPVVRHRILPFLLAGILGALVSISIVAFAPGNEERSATLPQRFGLVSAVGSSISYSLNFAERHTRRSRGVFLLSLVVPAWLLWISSKRKAINFGPSGRSLVFWVPFILGVGFALLLACFVPAFYALSGSPPLRMQILPKFVIVLMTMSLGFVLMSSLIKSKLIERHPTFVTAAFSTVLFALLLIVPISSARRTVELSGKASEYAAKWDEIELRIIGARQSGTADVVIPRLDANEFDLGFGRPDMLPTADPSDGRNVGIAKYYRVGSIKTE